MTLSNDLRERIVQARENKEGTYKELAERFNVGSATIFRICKRFRQTGSVEPRPHGGGRQHLINEDGLHTLLELKEKYPNSTTTELSEKYVSMTNTKVSRSTVARALKRLKTSGE